MMHNLIKLLFFFIIIALFNGCANHWSYNQPFYLVEYITNGYDEIGVIKIKKEQVKYYTDQKQNGDWSWGEVTGPFPPINKPMEYYTVRLIDINDKGKVLIINKERADILKIGGIDKQHVEDKVGSWYELRGAFYKKEVNYSDINKLLTVEDLSL